MELERVSGLGRTLVTLSRRDAAKPDRTIWSMRRIAGSSRLRDRPLWQHDVESRAAVFECVRRCLRAVLRLDYHYRPLDYHAEAVKPRPTWTQSLNCGLASDGLNRHKIPQSKPST